MGYYSGKAPLTKQEVMKMTPEERSVHYAEVEKYIQEGKLQRQMNELKADIEPSFIHKLFHYPKQGFLDWINKHRI